MVTDANLGHQCAKPEFNLTGLNIYLSNPSTNPSLVNPDFLRHNEIVDPSWTVTRPVIIEHGNSRVRYSNGLSFSANADHVVIAQRAPIDSENNSFVALELDDIVCIRAATNYLENVAPESLYDFITIDPAGMLDIELKETTDFVSPLQALAARIPFEGQIPDVQARAQYSFNAKTVTIYMSESNPRFDEKLLRIMVSGEIIYDIDEGDVNTQTNTIKDHLDAWEQDVQLFRELVYRFYSAYAPRER